jgi:streptogramin lyase
MLMLTDEDLTRELGAAFRTETEKLTYAGRTKPQRSRVVLVPMAAVVTAIAALAISLTLNDSPAKAPAVAGPAHSAAPTPAKTVNAKISLAGFTFAYQRTAGELAPVYATMEPGPVPDGFTPIATTGGTDAKAWVGKDPRSGDNAIYVKIADRNGGQLFALHSPVWTQDQLVDMFHNGTRAAVPLVKN